MIKKFILILTASLTLAGASAQAAVDAVIENGTAVIKAEDGVIPWVMLYNTDGVLCGVKSCAQSENGFSFEVDSNIRARAYLGNGRVEDINFIEPTASPKPTETEKPTAAVEPTETVKPAEPIKTAAPKFPEVYETEADAVRAFSVVTGVEKVSDEALGDGTYVTALRFGREEKAFVSDEITVTNASLLWSDLNGTPAYELQKGDVIRMSASLSGDINSLDFVYRPLEEDIVTGEADYGRNFEWLISNGTVCAGDKRSTVMHYGKGSHNRSEYVFGLVAEKTGKIMTLYNKEGKGEDALTIDLSQGTQVYVCDMSKKMEPQTGTVASIAKSGIPSKAFDENENITYSSDYVNNYVLARVINGVATDVVVYTNYNR